MDLMDYSSVDWSKMVMFIEVTDYCNARCIMCGAHRNKKYPHGRPRNMMALNDFKAIIDNLSGSPIRPAALVYSWLGESLLHPEFPEMLKYAETAGFSNQQFNTNGLALTPGVTDKLLRIGSLRRIHLSIDAAEPFYWKKIKGAGSFDVVLENLRYLIDHRRQCLSGLNLVFAFIVQQENYDNGMKFHQLISSMLSESGREFLTAWDVVHEHDRDVILFSRHITSAQSDANRLHKRFLAENGFLEESVDCESRESLIKTDQVLVENRFSSEFSMDENAARTPCAALWFMPNVDSTGKVTICCHDIDLHHSIGSLVNHSFQDLWFGPEMNAIRQLHVDGRFEAMKLCSKCGGIEHFTFT